MEWSHRNAVLFNRQDVGVASFGAIYQLAATPVVTTYLRRFIADDVALVAAAALGGHEYSLDFGGGHIGHVDIDEGIDGQRQTHHFNRELCTKSGGALPLRIGPGRKRNGEAG